MLSAAAPSWTRTAACSENMPAHDTPLPLVRVWLRFHEAELCRGVRARFTFDEGGMAVRSYIEDEGRYQKFLRLVEPLRRAYRIELEETRPVPKKEKEKDEGEPPPSLWENYALRSYLGDPWARSRIKLDSEDIQEEDPFAGDWLIKRRLHFFAEQTLDWNKKMERYAEELPPLTRTAWDDSAAAEVRSRAGAVCRAHAANLKKCLEKLEQNVKQALPPSDAASRRADNPDGAVAAGTPVESAERISEAARDVAGRVHRFIYPEQHTVELEDLRQPGLLESLRELRGMIERFQKALAHIGRP
jgi:hypothetical protein